MAHDYDYEPPLARIDVNTRIHAWRRSEGAARKFAVGTVVSFGARLGLSHYGGAGDPAYAPGNFPAFGFWAEFLHPTVRVEGRGSFATLNTYDRAAFTFGFMQFAVHVPNGDFILWFRKILGEQPDARDYFPMLAIRNGRIWRADGATPAALESAQSTKPLMDLLNPVSDHIEEAEILGAARLIDWTRRSVATCAAQVAIAADNYKRLLAGRARVYALDGRPDWQCQIIADIYHQGRGAKAGGEPGRQRRVKAALAAPDPLAALCAVGADESTANANRCTALALRIREKIAAGIFGRRRYEAASGDFG